MKRDDVELTERHRQEHECALKSRDDGESDGNPHKEEPKLFREAGSAISK